MKKSLLIGFGIIAAFLFIVISWFISVNNTLVSLDEGVKEKWSQVENVYQRRADLIPNLVSTVKGYAKHESEVLEEVTRARSQVGQVKIDSAEDLQKFDQAQQHVTGALSRLMVVAEKYPDLKANQNFLELQSQLEGTENRISVERMRFNEAAKEFNSYLRKFPQAIVAGMRGFHEHPYFAAAPGSNTAPKVEF